MNTTNIRLVTHVHNANSTECQSNQGYEYWASSTGTQKFGQSAIIYYNPALRENIPENETVWFSPFCLPWEANQSPATFTATTSKPRCLRRVQFGCYRTSSLANRTTPSASRSEFLVAMVLKAYVKQVHQQKNIIERPCRVNSVPEPSPESFQYGRFAFLLWGFAFLPGS